MLKMKYIGFLEACFLSFLSESLPAIIPREYALPEVQHALSKQDITKDGVPGRIHDMQFRDFWRNELCPPAFVMEAIENGYKIPLTASPPAARFRHNRSARIRENKAFLDDDIRMLERSKAIRRVKRRPKICNPLQVSHPEGRRKRLIMATAADFYICRIARSSGTL